MITVDGHKYNYEQIRQLCNQSEFNSKPDWYKSIFRFVLDFQDNKGFTVATSGSTGSPKQIVLTKEQLINSAKMTLTYFGLQANDTALLCLPAKYIGGKMMIVRAIVGNLNLITLEPNTSPLKNLDASLNLTFAAMTPMQVESSIKFFPKIYEQIQTIIVGGAGVSKPLEDSLAKCPNNNYSTFGMTETVSHIAMRKIGINNDFIYEALPGISLTTSDDNCLIITAPFISVSNLNTNDVVRLINRHQFIWSGRIDHVINSGGLKIHPETIESMLYDIINYPFLVVGISDHTLGEKAVIVMEGKISNEEKNSLLFQIANTIVGPERPRDIICMDTFEYAAQGKIDRRKTIQKIKH